MKDMKSMKEKQRKILTWTIKRLGYDLFNFITHI